jgi:hypothetical protein
VSVYRIHIRPGGGKADPAFSFAYCLREGVLGVGWQIEAPEGEVIRWEVYEGLALKEYGSAEALSRVRYLHDNVKWGDLLWTRDTAGKYYLGRASSPDGSPNRALAWEYFNTPDGRDADIVNVVRCRLFPIPQADDVPGKIVACFRPSRVIQSISDETAILYSEFLWNQLVGRDEYKLPFRDCDLFSFLDDRAIEDVVFIYLQCEGWIVVPNSRNADTMGYEFIAIHPKTGERALVQVKSGNTALETDRWGGFQEKIYLFQARGNYRGTPTANVTRLRRGDIEQFMRSHLETMPGAVRRWVDIAAKLNSPT